MRLGYIIIAALVLASIGIVSAANDDEILIFAKGVLASDESVRYNVNILGDNLSLDRSFGQYDRTDVDNIGYSLSRMAGLAKKIIDAYPDRFTRLDTKLYDITGTLIGTMNIIISPA
jgi:hypothetical protein